MVVTPEADHDGGRRAYAQREWTAAYEAFRRADREAPLGAEDLEALAVAAYMLGRVEEFLGTLERAHHAYVELGESRAGARAAVHLGVNLAMLGDGAQAGGWFARAQRLVDREKSDCPERGYLLLPLALRHEAAGEHALVVEVAAEAASLGERFGDRDLFALASHVHGNALIRLGRLDEGFRLLDEAMLAAVGGELTPIVTGIVYCGAIAGCEEAYELQRAHEWTGALARWWEGQPELVAFTGRCLAHRAEILQLHGAWLEALDEARRARERCERVLNRRAAGQAAYQQAEVLRRQGEVAAAEAAYRDANACGREPQPGLALLRLAAGDARSAGAAIRRALAETIAPLQRSRLLPASVEIAIALGDHEQARSACAELAAIASEYPSAMLGAISACVEGSVALAGGDPEAALVAARRALQGWQQVGAPRTRPPGRGCSWRRPAGRSTTRTRRGWSSRRRVRCSPSSERDPTLTASTPCSGPPSAGMSTASAAGSSRCSGSSRPARRTARSQLALVLSEHTVARHVQNIFAKLRVSSRTAAAAFAFERDLL